jgi:hypothetical protein
MFTACECGEVLENSDIYDSEIVKDIFSLHRLKFYAQLNPTIEQKECFERFPEKSAKR